MKTHMTVLLTLALAALTTFAQESNSEPTDRIERLVNYDKVTLNATFPRSENVFEYLAEDAANALSGDHCLAIIKNSRYNSIKNKGDQVEGETVLHKNVELTKFTFFARFPNENEFFLECGLYDGYDMSTKEIVDKVHRILKNEFEVH